MKRFAAVVFDMDGLLLDSERIALAAFNAACEHFAIGDQLPVFMRCVGTNAALGEDVLRAGLAGKADHVEFARVWDANYREATFGRAIPLKPGAVELLADLHSLGVPAGVATSTATERAIQKLRGANILGYFDVVVGGDQVARSKPQPDIYLRAAERLRAAPGACLALEDSENGVHAALAAGMTVVQVPDLVPASDAMRALGHVIVDSLHDVRRLGLPTCGPSRLSTPKPWRSTIGE